MKVLFLYLTAFSKTGGIEKFNQAFMKASSELSVENNIDFKAYSLHDHSENSNYIAPSDFKGFSGSMFLFAIQSIMLGLRSDVLIIGHVNLAIVGLVIKMLKKDIKVIYVAHGVEVWSKLSLIKKKGLECADRILSVSNFTKQKLEDVQGIHPQKITIFLNTFDPFFEAPADFDKPEYLMDKYGLNESSKIILSVCRIEIHKGYDKVLSVLPEIIKEIPDLKYIIIGKGDERGVERVKKQIQDLKLENKVVLAGFVPDKEIRDYYLLSDVFALPSTGEGFGIVFIEAQICGRPVIAGNTDGSVEAVQYGRTGVLVDPTSKDEIKAALLNVLKGNVEKRMLDSRYLSDSVMKKFGFDSFKKRLKKIMSSYS